MHRALERLDSAAGALVPLAYLSGLLLGTWAYFAGHVPDIAIAVAIGLAVGSELHSFLQQRRARAAYAEYQRVRQDGTGNLEVKRDQLRGQVLILSLLVLFQCFTATAYAAETWHPATDYLLPPAVQIAIRGCIIPILFLLSGFLVPLQQSPGAVLQHASGEILHFAVSRNVRHWRKRIRRVHHKGGDLSPLMVALLEEEGEGAAARRTALIATNLQTAEQQIRLRPGGLWSRLLGKAQQPDTLTGALLGPAAVPVVPATLSLEGPEPDPDPTPQGPGRGRSRRTPAAAAASRGSMSATGPALQLVAAPGTSPTTARTRQHKAGNTSRPMEDNAQLRAQRVQQAREILAQPGNARISAERLGDLIGAPKTVALGIKREILAEARGAAATTQQQRSPRRMQTQRQQQLLEQEQQGA